MVRYIFDFSLKNGLGKPAISLYLSGCDKFPRCENCHNPELQEYVESDLDRSEIIGNIKKDLDKRVQRVKDFYEEVILCFLGGEPLASYNRRITYEISKYSKKKEVINVLYSWREIEDISKEDIMHYVDYMDYGVLGSFDKESKVNNQLPASSNQYIWNFNKNKKVEPVKLK